MIIKEEVIRLTKRKVMFSNMLFLIFLITGAACQFVVLDSIVSQDVVDTFNIACIGVLATINLFFSGYHYQNAKRDTALIKFLESEMS